MPWLRRHRTRVLLFLGALVVYGGLAGPRLRGASSDPHFVWLADAWLHGSLELTGKPPHRNDWASYRVVELKDGRTVAGVYRTPGHGGAARRFETLEGPVLLLERSHVRKSRTRYFVSFPPFPALLLLPFVAIFRMGTNDVLFNVVVAACNVVGVHVLLRRLARSGQSERSPREDLALTLLFGLGTAHLWCSVLGQVWFTALVVGVACSCGFLLAVEARRPWLAGLALAAGLATRPMLALLSIYYPLRLLWTGERWDLSDLGVKVREVAAAAVLPLLAVGLLFLHNWLRFRHPLEFGHSYLAEGTIQRIAWHGLFSPRFVPKNLVAALVLWPRLQGAPPFVIVSRHGMSLLLATPVFLWLLRPLRRPAVYRALWVAAACVAVPLLFYQNTGYEQFSYRFSLDVTPVLVVLLAVGGRRLSPLFWVAFAWAVAVNGFGAVVFKRFGAFFDDHFPLEDAL